MDINHKFYPLESGNDVLSFNGNAYIVSKLKELISQQIKRKLKTSISDNQNNFVDFFEQIYNENIFFKTHKMIWYSSQEGNKCNILRVGYPEWQPGRLRTKAEIEFYKIQPRDMISDTGLKIEVVLEFCHDKMTKDKSPFNEQIAGK